MTRVKFTLVGGPLDGYEEVRTSHESWGSVAVIKMENEIYIARPLSECTNGLITYFFDHSPDKKLPACGGIIRQMRSKQ